MIVQNWSIREKTQWFFNFNKASLECPIKTLDYDFLILFWAMTITLKHDAVEAEIGKSSRKSQKGTRGDWKKIGHNFWKIIF